MAFLYKKGCNTSLPLTKKQTNSKSTIMLKVHFEILSWFRCDSDPKALALG